MCARARAGAAFARGGPGRGPAADAGHAARYTARLPEPHGWGSRLDHPGYLPVRKISTLDGGNVHGRFDRDGVAEGELAIDPQAVVARHGHRYGRADPFVRLC